MRLLGTVAGVIAGALMFAVFVAMAFFAILNGIGGSPL